MNDNYSFRWGVDLFDNKHTQIPNWVLAYYHRVGITNTEMMFITHLASFKHETASGKASPSLTKTLRERMGYKSNQGIINVQNGLIEKGLLIVNKSRGRRSEYDFAPFSKKVVRIAMLEEFENEDKNSSTKLDDPKIDPSTKLDGGSSTKLDGGRQQNLTRKEEVKEKVKEISPFGERSPSDPDLTDTPSSPSADRVSAFGDHADNFWDDVVESIGRHTDQEMMGDRFVSEEEVRQIHQFSQMGITVKQIGEKVNLPLDLINDILYGFEGLATEKETSDPDLTDILTELAEDEALAGDDFSDITVPRTNAKLLSESDAAYLRTLGKFSGSELPDVYDTIQEIKVVWEIKDPTEELAIALFLLAIRTKRSAFAIPKNQGIRNDWIKSVRGHLMDYKVNNLGDLYQLAITKLDQAGMTFSRPGSLTKTLPDVVDEPTAVQETFDLSQHKIVPPTPVDTPPVKSALTPQQIDEQFAKARKAMKNAKD